VLNCHALFLSLFPVESLLESWLDYEVAAVSIVMIVAMFVSML
jgi:hypothetical protein